MRETSHDSTTAGSGSGGLPIRGRSVLTIAVVLVAILGMSFAVGFAGASGSGADHSEKSPHDGATDAGDGYADGVTDDRHGDGVKDDRHADGGADDGAVDGDDRYEALQVTAFCTADTGELEVHNPNDVPVEVTLERVDTADLTNETAEANDNATFTDLADGTYNLSATHDGQELPFDHEDNDDLTEDYQVTIDCEAVAAPGTGEPIVDDDGDDDGATGIDDNETDEDLDDNETDEDLDDNETDVPDDGNVTDPGDGNETPPDNGNETPPDNGNETTSNGNTSNGATSTATAADDGADVASADTADADDENPDEVG